jgi:hypothetical protein
LLLHRQRSVFFQPGYDAIEQCRSFGVDLDTGVTAVGAAVTYLNIEDFEFSSELDDQVQNLGKDQESII